MKTFHEIHFKDSGSMDDLAEESVHLVVTSPPYPMIEMWDELFSDQDPATGQGLSEGKGREAFESMHGILDRIWGELDRVMISGGIVCVNIGDATRRIGGHFQLYPNHTRIISVFLEMGYQMLPMIIWRKSTNKPNKFMGSGMYPPNAYVTLEHEYILIFRKGGIREFTAEERERSNRSSYYWEERNRWFSDVWSDLKGANQTIIGSDETRDRSAAYPFELPFRLINMFSIYGDTVLDPFLGTGTTMFASSVLGRNSAGYEISNGFNKEISKGMRALPTISRRTLTKRFSSHLLEMGRRKEIGKHPGNRMKHYQTPVVTKQEEDMVHLLVRDVKVNDGGFEVLYHDEEESIRILKEGSLVQSGLLDAYDS